MGRQRRGSKAVRGAKVAPPRSADAPPLRETPAPGKPAGAAPGPPWIEGLAKSLRRAGDHGRPTARTALGCDVGTEGRSRLFVPPEMPTLQPASLRWLLRFAAANEFALVEDRRGRREEPFMDRRSGTPPAMALGLGLLLKQSGLPGPVARLSSPHRHAADSPFIDLPELVALAAHAAPRSKRVVVLPNRPLVDVLQGDTGPIAGYACRMDSAPARTVLSHFEGPSLRCAGYSAGTQYVVHLLLGGGPASAPALWSDPATLARTDLRFRLFRGRGERHDFGLLYSTFWFDVADRRPAPWWLEDEAFRGETDAVAAPELALAS